MSWGNRPWGNVRSWTMSPRPAVASFTPAQLTNLRGWWKSDTGITIATGVSQWDDQSGLGNHLLQATGAAQPVVTAGAINGLPAITFDGVDDVMQAAFTLAQPETVFIVLRQDTWVSTRGVFDGATNLTMLCSQNGLSGQLNLFAGSSGPTTSGPTVGSFGLMTVIGNGVNSTMQRNSDAQVVANAGAGAPNGLTIGCRGGLTLFSAISVAEIIIMAATATANERANMRAYSQARYGVGA